MDDELKKWTAAFRSWPWHRQETALSLIEVDEDSVAALKEDHDLLELKELLIIALKEDISRLEQENRSLRERLASQLDPKQHREPERAEPEQAEPVSADAVDEPKSAAHEVIEQERREREPDPAQSLSELEQVALLIFQERATPGCPWIGLIEQERLGIDDDTIDRLAAAARIVSSPGNPHEYGIPVEDPRRREDEDVEEATPPSMAA